MTREGRAKGFWPLAIFFAAFVLFLYGPVITIFVLSFQGPEGGLTFPLRGVSLQANGARSIAPRPATSIVSRTIRTSR